MKNVLMGVMIIFFIIYFSLYFNMPSFIVKPKIQKYLDDNYSVKFKVTQVERNYLPDWFHQVWGYQIEIQDSLGIKVNNIYVIQRNGKWKLFKGSNIESQYNKAKSAGTPLKNSKK